jgi:hypothetical protein
VPRSRWQGLRSRLLGTSRWRRLTAAAGSIGLAALAIGIVVVTELPASSQGASPGTATSGATTVQRRDLVSTDTQSGTLSYANPQTVFNRLSGTITSLPNIGEVIRPGQTLYRVSGAPVVLLDGTVPAYRALTSGDSAGADILALNRNLRKLGFDSAHQIALNDTWQAATTTAVEVWQASLGEAQTGTVTLGQAVFLPGPQRITAIDSVLGSTGGAGGSSSASGAASASGTGSASAATTAAASAPAARSEFVSLSAPCAPAGAGAQPKTTTSTTATTSTATTTTSTTPTTSTPPPPTSCSPKVTPPGGSGTSKSGGRTPSQEAALLALLKAETLELRQSLSASRASSRSSSSGAHASTGTGSSSGAAHSAGSGVSAGATGSTGAGSSTSGSGAAGNAVAILQTTSSQLVVTVDLDATKQSEAVVGEPVAVQLPNGNTVGGKITEVSPVAQSASSSSSTSGSGSGSGSSSSAPSATVPVTIGVTGHHQLRGLDQAAVSVSFRQQVENHVLSVPVTALLATAGGGYAIQEAAAPHRLIAVTPGLFAAGYVQISGVQVYPGLQVTDSQG